MGKLWGYSGLAALAAGLLAAPATPANAQAQRQTAKCETLESCIAEVRDPDIRVNGSSIPAKDRITSYGDDAVVALIPLLQDPNARVREDAGYLLHSFRDIDPRHYEALVAGWNRPRASGRRNGWLIIPIAATRTDEALELLWADFEREPNTSSNSQIFFALPMFGEERLKPLILQRLEQCRLSEDGKPCAGINALLNEMEEPIRGIDKVSLGAWVDEAMVDLAAKGRSEGANNIATSFLARRLHPAGVALLIDDLDAIEIEGEDAAALWPTMTIQQLAAYGGDAHQAGPSIARFLNTRLDPDVRARAALALGHVGAVEQAADLIAMEAELRDDWLLAYNVAEALGRLRDEAAKPMLERLAASYWHDGVRNNAERALRFMPGGELAGSDASFETGLEEIREEDRAWGTYDLRWDGDDASYAYCDDDQEVRIRQDPVARIRFPKEGARRVSPDAPARRRARAARDAVPYEVVRGGVVAIAPMRDGDLIAFNGGEFGGGLVHLPGNGKPEYIVADHIDAMWEMDGKYYVAAGLAHLVVDRGTLYVVDKRSLRVERSIRLPASPRGLQVTSDRAVIVETGAGEIAIREDGVLLDAGELPACD